MEEGTETRTAKMRVFVGGLGESVTVDDLRRIFGPLGVVEGLDIVRTKGRSFAYVDFRPSSLNSLSKLFSTVHFFLFPPLLLYIISSIGFASIGEYPFEHASLHVISSSNF
uniref:Birch protein n=1 Tax=Betula platyphylla TaxID=78630 RepID=A0A9E9L6A5_BETPL|nr:birch protein [Betula platyphylla]